MSTFKKILIAVDLDESSARYVLECARQLSPQAEFEVIHVLERSHFYNMGDPAFAMIDDLHLRVVGEAKDYLQNLCVDFGIRAHQLLEGHAATVIQQHADEGDHDLIVLGTHGRHGIRRLLGSTANAVLHGTGRNVLAIRVPGGDVEPKPAKDKYQHVLAAVDLSAESDQVLDVAQMTAQREGAALKIAHVIKPFHHAYAGINPSTLADIGVQFEHEADKQARQQLAEIARGRGLKETDTVVRHGAPAPELHGIIEEFACDLLVVGTHGKHGVELLLGSTANAVIHGVTCDVLAVRIR
ncbi:MAG: universal stress protein [Pseudomonadales bacterium]